MDRFKEMQVFTRIAERNSFSLAAEDLRIPRATVSNLVKRLETRLGVRLLERTTRQVRLTTDGESYYHQCVRLLADLEEIENDFSGSAPKGQLRVNLQGTLAKHFVMPALGQFISRYPDISLHIAEDDRLIDLVKEGVDCVLRAGELQDSSLIAKRIAHMTQVTVASPGYLAQFGIPADLQALKQHRAVGYSLDTKAQPSSLDFLSNGETVTLNLSCLISVAGAELYTGAAKAGVGLIQVPRYRVEQELQTGELIEVLPQTPPPAMPVSVLYPQRRHLSLRTRVFMQWLSELFQQAG